ncbi:hypothetical protein [Marinobacter goseongensis]|uniref:hypothetical protein n=1 Tax=Marinobacter goseongensis TaxID=453838 RepID=UPI0020034577|nr:hypothetical protein [Marinobacter goseongensis]MCK7553374.1 hypothetical protein [Marinobacter goseongensis]
MKKNVQFEEFHLLGLWVDEMEASGSNRNLVSISVNEELKNRLCSEYGVSVEMDEIVRMADKCLAHEWLQNKYLGSKYLDLFITAGGVGVVRSKRLADSRRRNRSRPKKISDWVEEHKGLTVLIGLILALLTLWFRFGSGGH